MSLNEWFEILNWKELPFLGDIIILPEKQFFDLYFHEDYEIEVMLKNLLIGLRGEYPQHNLRIVGSPGIGKTSFIHYLKYLMKISKESVYSKYFIFIFHCETSISNDKLDKKTLHGTLLEALIEFFKENKISEKIYEAILSNEEISYNEKINSLLNYYEKNNSKFSKNFIIVLDDIDTIKNDDLIVELVDEILRHTNINRIKKWLCIRDIKYSRFNEEIRDHINTLFPEPIRFPKTSLRNVLWKRIEYIETSQNTGRNPFSDELCCFLLKMLKFDFRQSLAMTKKILEEAPRKGIEHSGEEWISNYFQRVSTKTLLKHQVIPNIFENAVNTKRFFPLEKEILALLAIKNRIDGKFHKIINDALNSKLKALLRSRGSKESYNIIPEMSDIEDAIEFLLDKGLIEKTNIKDRYIITDKGWEINNILDREFYLDFCKEIIAEQGKKLHKYYWEIASITSYYGEYIYDDILS